MTELARKKPLKRRGSVIRRLPDDQPIPDGTPRRYKNQAGYIRLRWKVGNELYFEEYEHRVVMGRPPQHLDVHHINGDKADNRPENLRILTRAAHAKLHQDLERERDPERGQRYGGHRSRARMEQVLRERARLEQRRALALEMKGRYEAGSSTVDIAEEYGTTHTRVTTLLRFAGAKVRKSGESRERKTVYSSPEARKVIAELRAGEVTIAQAAREIGGDPVALRKRVAREVKRDVFARDGARCGRCGLEAHDAHHRAALGSGGPRNPLRLFGMGNLIALCRSCHDWVGQHPEAAIRDGFSVKRLTTLDPADVPLLYHGARWVRLDHHGGITTLAHLDTERHMEGPL